MVGTSARPEDATDPHRFAVHRAGRGWQYTCHGPGQRIVNNMLDLNPRDRDVRRFVCALEGWVIDNYDKTKSLGFRLQFPFSKHWGTAINTSYLVRLEQCIHAVVTA